MLWSEGIPHVAVRDEEGKETSVTLVAGRLGGSVPPAPPPRSWASRADTDVAIWCIRMSPGARWTLPAATGAETQRTLYFFAGGLVTIGERALSSHVAAAVRAEIDLPLQAGADGCELLLLQGKPIGQPIAAYGPFVMNNRDEIERAVEDYRRTRFGGWPWPKDDPVHAAAEGRFAKHVDGRLERPRSEA
jgi:redox-sensitive bicupin YhaK (pirin superfamily)